MATREHRVAPADGLLLEGEALRHRETRTYAFRSIGVVGQSGRALESEPHGATINMVCQFEVAQPRITKWSLPQTNWPKSRPVYPH